MRRNAYKRFAGVVVLAAATVFAGSASAQLAKFVIQGDAAKTLMEKNEITVDTARKLAESCTAFAAQNKQTLSVAILDQFGEPVYFARMDGQGKTNIETAFLKAKTVLNTRQPSHLQLNRVLQGQTSEFHTGFYNGNFANAGALPIMVDGQFLGAIGVGGSPPSEKWSDEKCAQHALEAVIGPQPALLPDLPRVYKPGADGG
jgi:uncharacterized protein GlcG (DUF336 family)